MRHRRCTTLRGCGGRRTCGGRGPLSSTRFARASAGSMRPTTSRTLSSSTSVAALVPCSPPSWNTYTGARGVLLDHDTVVADAHRVLGGLGVAARVELASGDFFEAV